MVDVTNGAALAIQLAILLLAALSLGFSLWAAREGSPVLAILGRWLRWFFLTMLVAGAAYIFNWSPYGFGTLFLVSMLVIFLVETGYNWVAISALSKSQLPLFPRFEENERGEEWPSMPALIRLREWLRKSGYQRRQSLVATVEEMVLLRVVVYENEDQSERLHVLFLPNARGATAVACAFLSLTQDGEMLVTDNMFLPFGGFYPESWHVERRPWSRSIASLQRRHRARIDAVAKPLQPFIISPLEQINQEQRQLEQLNRELGFLRIITEEGATDRLTGAGKARIWQEVWTLSYLGLPLRYS